MGIQTRLGPFANGLNIALREFCRPMHQKIGSQRHIVTLHFLAECLEALARVFRGIFRVAPHPIGKIRVPATAITNHDTGATLLYQGQRVRSEWQS